MTRPPRVLIVEDDPELLHALLVRLTAVGLTCETAVNGKEGLEKISQTLPDLIVADLVMPEMDGYEMVYRVQLQNRTAAIPVIVLTAVPEHALDQRITRLKVDKILHKPFDSEELVVTIRELLARPIPGGPHHG